VIAAGAVGTPLNGVRDHAGFERIFMNAESDLRVGRKRLPRLCVLHQLDPEQQPFAANIAHYGIPLKAFQSTAEFSTNRLDAREQIFALDVIEHRVRRGSGYGMSVIRETVHERACSS